MNLEEASKYHRFIVQTFFALILFAIAGSFIPEGSPFYYLGLVLIVFNMFCCFKLASAIEKSGLLWCILSFFGFFLIWVPQFLLINSANKAFKAAGKKTNFMGGMAEGV